MLPTPETVRMQPEIGQPPAPFNLLPSLALLCVALVAAILFGSAFKTYSPDVAEMVQPQGEAPKPHAEDHADHNETEGPMYFAGGLWSPELGLAGLSELATLAIFPNDPIICQSVSWNAEQQKLIVIDVSPIKADNRKGSDDASLAIVSVDHAGSDITPEFATAIQQHMGTLKDFDKIVIVTPLPGPDSRPEDEFPYDWTFLQDSDKVGMVDWAEVEPKGDLEGRPGSGYLRAWVQAEASIPDKVNQDRVQLLIADLAATLDRKVAAQRIWALAMRSPYEVIPQTQISLTSDTDANPIGPPSRQDSITLYRAMNIHCDDLIKEAAGSENSAHRASAARTIGNLADQTTDPLGKLTLLAEDKDMAVRYEALVATRAVPGRRAAGVAELVGPMTMSDEMRTVYEATMAELLTYGEPVPADSRANRLRRMTMSELLAEERDELVCSILLERADLPDQQIKPVVQELAKAKQAQPLTAFMDLLTGMNPRTLRQRDPLLRSLVEWDKNELKQQAERLSSIANSDAIEPLRTAVAGAVIQSSADPSAITSASDGIYFKGLSWVTDADALKRIADEALKAALDPSAGTDPRVQIAALDALRYLPPAAMTAQTIQGILGIARGAEDIDLRFAAIRAINALPDSAKPADIDDLKLTSLTISAKAGMLYDQVKLTAVAGRPVEITLVNPDNMQHNLAISKPGRMQEVGLAISSMNPADAAAINYIPESDAVLYHTKMLDPGMSDTLRFIAPDKPGNFPYVCTFPGHYTSMNGVLEVVAP